MAAPHTISIGPNCFIGGQRDPEHAPARGHEDLAVVVQVAREEDHDRDLRELRGLEGDAADVDVQVGAVDFAADARQARQHRHRRSPTAAIVYRYRSSTATPRLSQREDRGREQHQADDHPLGLLAREHRFDPVDHHNPDARQHGGQREQVGVGVRERDPDQHVRRQAQRQEQGSVPQRCARGAVQRQVRGRRSRAVLGLDEDRREARRDEDG